MRARVAFFLSKEAYMEIPLDPLVCTLVKLLDADLREDFEERAAIIEYDAGVERAHAECLALLAILNRKPLALSRVRAVQFEFHGVRQWLLTTDLATALMQVGYAGGMEVGVVDLADVVAGAFGGQARLSKGN
jgi:hypothetical protein